MLPIAAPRNYNDKILIVTALPIDEPSIADPPPAVPAPPAPCVSKSCYIALNHEDVLVVDRSCDGSLAARMRSQAVDVDIVMKIEYTTFQSSCVRKISN